MLTVDISTDNHAMQTNQALAAVLDQAAQMLREGSVSGVLRDAEGHRVGHFFRFED